MSQAALTTGSNTPRAPLETVAVLHVAALIVFASWAFGGNAAWSRDGVCWWGSLGLFVTLAEAWRRCRTPGEATGTFLWLAPLLGLDLLVLASCLHPSFRLAPMEGAVVYLPIEPNAGWLSTARPEVSLRALWLANALYLPAFNLAVAVRSRSRLRALLLGLAANAVLLAVFGALQKLSHAPGLFFGAVPSPNPRFFASFIYANHWGAFAVLMVCFWLGLLFHWTSEAGRYRDFLHSPAFAAFVATLVLAGAVPLSASRSAALLTAAALVVGITHALLRAHAHRRRGGAGAAAIVGGGIVLLVLGLGAGAYLAQGEILSRAADTREQWAEMRKTSSIGARAQLYGDTWRMARDRLGFGWGLGSFPIVFELYNRQTSPDRLPVYFEDAHSDWLQSLAEVGLVGSFLRALLVVPPLAAAWKARARTPLVLYPLLGCALLLLYAWVEFPFGNTAVTAAFWAAFFTAVRLAQLETRECAA